MLVQTLKSRCTELDYEEHSVVLEDNFQVHLLLTLPQGTGAHESGIQFFLGLPCRPKILKRSLYEYVKVGNLKEECKSIPQTICFWCLIHFCKCLAAGLAHTLSFSAFSFIHCSPSPTQGFKQYNRSHKALLSTPLFSRWFSVSVADDPIEEKVVTSYWEAGFLHLLRKKP